MVECPVCFTPLVQQKTPHGLVYMCRQCRGRSATLPVLRKAGATRSFLGDLWQRSTGDRSSSSKRCPHCLLPMAEVASQVDGHGLRLDVCRRCTAIWFDGSEFDALPREGKREPARVEDTLSPAAREQLALYQLKRDQDLARRESYDAGPEHAWQWLPALFGLPVELDAPALSRRPWVTWSALGACVAATAVLLAGGFPADGTLLHEWGFIPAEWWRRGGFTLLSSFFLHAGLFHLVGNMYFLFVFGDNVEDRLGWMPFVTLLLAAHLVGMAAHGMVGHDKTTPCIGASAGISGVIAFYAITFPKARLGFMWRHYVAFRWFHMSAIVALGLYVLMQAVGAAFQINGFGGVSYLAHLGGLATGALVALVYRNQRQREAARTLGRPRQE